MTEVQRENIEFRIGLLEAQLRARERLPQLVEAILQSTERAESLRGIQEILSCDVSQARHIYDLQLRRFEGGVDLIQEEIQMLQASLEG